MNYGGQSCLCLREVCLMAIAPLQLPGYAAPQSLDFSSLANLGQVYKQANRMPTGRPPAQLGQGERLTRAFCWPLVICR